MPYMFGRRNRSVHFALTLILGALILSFLFHHPEHDTEVENFSTDDVKIKHQLTSPTPIIAMVEHPRFTPNALSLESQATTPAPTIAKTEYSQMTHEATSIKHPPQPTPTLVHFSNRTMSVATLELLSENGLNFPFEGPLVEETDLCLPGKCKLAHLSDDQTCHNFAAEALAQREVLAWNPSAAKGLESGTLCRGLEKIGGIHICTSEPGKEIG